MEEIIKSILDAGHDVTIICVTQRQIISNVTDTIEKLEIIIPKETQQSKAVTGAKLKNKVSEKKYYVTESDKKKIKEMKENGIASKDVSEKLNISLPLVNKYWV
jgi:hypothetical protein